VDPSSPRLLRKELVSLARPGEELDACFMRWYLEVRLAPSSPELKITDGPGDGGIDAIVFGSHGDGRTVIVQSHATDLEHAKPLSLPKLKDFLKLPEVFHSEPNKFRQWLKDTRVRPNLHREYQSLSNKIRSGRIRPQWLYLTTAKANNSAHAQVNSARRTKHEALLADRDDVFRAFALYLEGAAPPDDPLEFRFREQPLRVTMTGQPAMAVYAAVLDDLIKYVQRDKLLRLFSRNVRLLISQSPINNRIVDTYHNAPRELLTSHNGLTIICAKSSITRDKVILEQPNVVNGAQTLLSLAGEHRLNGAALVLARVVDVGDYKSNAGLIRNIVLRTNTQNSISPPDLVACDQRQVEIERFFRAQGRIYIRRRGQELLEMGPRAGAKIRSIRLAQVLACCDEKVGVYAAGHSKNDLFEGDNYEFLFEQPSLQEILSRYCMFELIDASRREAKKALRGKLRYAWRNVLAAVWSCICEDQELRSEVCDRGVLNAVKLKERTTKPLREVLLMMLMFAWKRYWAEAQRRRDLKPDQYFFGDKNRTVEICATIERRFSRRLTRALRQVVVN